MTIQAILSWATQELSQFESARLDAELLLAKILEKDRAYLMSHNEEVLEKSHLQHFKRWINKRKTGFPVAYILGVKEFYGLALKVTPDVLIPRPDTEVLVEAVLKYFKPGDLILEVGTGSGCIAISLLKTNPEIKIIATDISKKALKIAQENAKNHGVEDRIEFFQSDLLKKVPLGLLKEKEVIVVANLPYVPLDHKVNIEAEFEPKLALYAENEGLKLYYELFKQLESIKPKAAFLECYEFQIELLNEKIKNFKLKEVKNMLGQARLSHWESS